MRLLFYAHFIDKEIKAIDKENKERLGKGKAGLEPGLPGSEIRALHHSVIERTITKGFLEEVRLG